MSACRKYRLYVVTTCHEGSDMCVRDATSDEIDEENRTHEGWAMPYENAVAVAQRHAREFKCRWFDFSTEGP